MFSFIIIIQLYKYEFTRAYVLPPLHRSSRALRHDTSRGPGTFFSFFFWLYLSMFRYKVQCVWSPLPPLHPCWAMHPPPLQEQGLEMWHVSWPLYFFFSFLFSFNFV
jgi:hypothetical protein